MTRVGVLALQGDVPEHRQALRELLPDTAIHPVRRPEDLDGLDALFLPGGESTTLSRLLESSGLDRAIADRGGKGLPILATCAGLILIARELEPSEFGRDPKVLGLLDVEVRRNDYGRQRESFEAPLRVPGIEGPEFPGVFIRAPRILRRGKGVEPIAFRGEEVVGVRQGALWGLCFHPELSGDRRLHRAFLAAVAASRTPRRAGAR